MHYPSDPDESASAAAAIEPRADKSRLISAPSNASSASDEDYYESLQLKHMHHLVQQQQQQERVYLEQQQTRRGSMKASDCIIPSVNTITEGTASHALNDRPDANDDYPFMDKSVISLEVKKAQTKSSTMMDEESFQVKESIRAYWRERNDVWKQNGEERVLSHQFQSMDSATKPREHHYHEGEDMAINTRFNANTKIVNTQHDVHVIDSAPTEDTAICSEPYESYDSSTKLGEINDTLISDHVTTLNAIIHGNEGMQAKTNSESDHSDSGNRQSCFSFDGGESSYTTENQQSRNNNNSMTESTPEHASRTAATTAMDDAGSYVASLPYTPPSILRQEQVAMDVVFSSSSSTQDKKSFENDMYDSHTNESRQAVLAPTFVAVNNTRETIPPSASNTSLAMSDSTVNTSNCANHLERTNGSTVRHAPLQEYGTRKTMHPGELETHLPLPQMTQTTSSAKLNPRKGWYRTDKFAKQEKATEFESHDIYGWFWKKQEKATCLKENNDDGNVSSKNAAISRAAQHVQEDVSVSANSNQSFGVVWEDVELNSTGDQLSNKRSDTNVWGLRFVDSKKNKMIMTTLIITALVLIAGIVGVLASNRGNGDVNGNRKGIDLFTAGGGQSINETPPPTPAPLSQEEQIRYDRIKDLLLPISGGEVLEDTNSFQYTAFQWVFRTDPMHVDVSQENTMIQRYILAVLYYATGGDNWTLCRARDTTDSLCYDENNNIVESTKGRQQTNFLSLVPECAWYGIRCNGQNVASIALRGNNLAGTLPKELVHLPQLTYLYLDRNSLRGSIPTSLFATSPSIVQPKSLNPSKLKRINLSSNELTGNLPTILGTLTNLQSLVLSQNKLDGSIPHELFLPIATSSTTITKCQLRVIEISNNGNTLTGTIPQEMWSCRHLQKVDFQGNAIGGSLPNGIDMTRLTKLKELLLGQNRLGGTLPADMFQTGSALKKLGLNHNRFNGQVPTEIGNLLSLEALNVTYNDLTGPMPGSVCALKSNNLVDISSDCKTTNSHLAKIDCACCTTCVKGYDT